MLQLGRDAGWDIGWENLDPKANIHASILSGVNPQTPAMRDLLEPLVTPYRPPPARSAGARPEPEETPAPTESSGLTMADYYRMQQLRENARVLQERAAQRPPNGNRDGGGYRPGPGTDPPGRPQGPRR